MRSVWRHLALAHLDDAIPPLVMKFEIGTSDYTIWLSDLTLIWSEKLDRKRIIQRSFTIDTSIDPSEGSDQLRLFLQKIGDALDQRDNTRLTLVQHDAKQKLLLRTLTPLPGSLKPLEWFIELAPAPQSVLSSELILPMLNQRVTAELEKISLLQALKEKDQVIAKLTDKLQADGTDLGRLFPGVASSKSGKPISRQTLSKSVKGLGEFDEERWQENLLRSSTSPNDPAKIVPAAFEINTVIDSEVLQASSSNEWWEKLRHKESQLTEPSQIPLRSQVKEEPSQDDFQRQLTPPNRRETSTITRRDTDNEAQNPHTSMPQPGDSDSTTDESEHDSPSAPSKSVTTRSKLVLDDQGSRASSPGASPEAPWPSRGKQPDVVNEHENGRTSAQAHNDDLDDSTDSSSDGDAAGLKHSSRAASRPIKDDMTEKAPLAPKPKAKLGKIGGKAKTTSNTSINPSSSNGISPKPEEIKPTLHTRLKSQTEKGSVPADERARGARATVRPESFSLPRETSQERANRKREQLKRELEIKSQAGAKKKRKF